MPSRPSDFFSAHASAPQGDGALGSVAELFLELADLDADERTARLAAITDDDLRRDVAALLDADEEADTVLGRLDRLAPPSEPVGTRVGETVGPYRITGELGRGGMGVVVRARDERLGRDVALKFLPRALSADPEARARLLAEARAASALDHPNVCTVHGVEEIEDGQLVLVLACYEGETLKARLARGPLPVEEAERITREIAAGLAAAHQNGIVHRDVKPSNVLLTENGTVKVLDFGIARSAESDLTRTGATLGTAAYMSPEQTLGERVDARADVWALGIVLVEMLTGKRPFRGSGEVLIHAIRHDAPAPLPAETPPRLTRVAERALAKAPADRYADAAAMLADLDGERGPAQRPHRWRWAVGVGVVLLLAVLLVGLFRNPDPIPDDVFVIAVAPFSAVGEGAEAEAEVMQALIRREREEVVEEEGGLEVIVLPGMAPRTRAEAEARGRAGGAHLVVWGDILVLGDEVEMQPALTLGQPYVGSASATSELAGAAAFRADLTADDQLALRRTAAAEVRDLVLLIAARAYAERSRPAQALTILEDIRTPSAASERIAGLAFALQRAFDIAEQHLREAQRLDPDNVATYEWLVTVLMNTGQPTEAEAVARQGLEHRPDEANLYAVLAWTLVWQGRAEESVVAAERAVALAPESARLQYGLGWAHFMTGRLEDAAQAFQTAVAEAEGVQLIDAYEGLMESLFALGRFPEAEVAAREAVALRPEHPVDHDLLGQTLFAQGKLAEAEAEWQTSLSLSESAATAVYLPLLIAYVRARRGHPDPALDLRVLGDTLSTEPFLTPILRVALGQATEEEALAQAAQVNAAIGRDWLREAHWMLGHLYEAGVGVLPADTAKALTHYRDALARDFYPEGALNLLRVAEAQLAQQVGQ